jgi:phosphopentomutase
VSGARRNDVVSLGDRPCFADLGATVADVLGVATEGLAGESFGELLR